MAVLARTWLASLLLPLCLCAQENPAEHEVKGSLYNEVWLRFRPADAKTRQPGVAPQTRWTLTHVKGDPLYYGVVNEAPPKLEFLSAQLLNPGETAALPAGPVHAFLRFLPDEEDGAHFQVKLTDPQGHWVTLEVVKPPRQWHTRQVDRMTTFRILDGSAVQGQSGTAKAIALGALAGCLAIDERALTINSATLP